jgi:hypothetical protein
MSVEHPKYVYSHLPKTGGTFIVSYLCKFADGKKTSMPHAWLSDVNTTNKFVFSSIRNPFCWYISYWKEANRGGHVFYRDLKQKDPNKFVDFLLHKKSEEVPLFSSKRLKEYDIGYLTDLFLLLCCNTYPTNLDNVRGHISTHKIIRFEHLRKGLYEIVDSKIFNLGENKKSKIFTLPKANATKHNHYSTYYTDETIELIRHKDRLIFNLFGYEFEYV